MHIKATAVTVEDDSDDNIPEDWKQSSVDAPSQPMAKTIVVAGETHETLIAASFGTSLLLADLLKML